MSGIVVEGAMGLRPGQVLGKLERAAREGDCSFPSEVEWIGIRRSGGYKVIKARHRQTGHADELPDYAQNPEVVTLR